MSQYQDVLDTIKAMPIEEISMLRAEIETITRDKALAELQRRAQEDNDLRVLAGMKRKPIKKAASAPAPKKSAKKD